MDQNTSEITPYTSPGVGLHLAWSTEKTVCSAYSGLVPMSPKTTPSAAMTSAVMPACRGDRPVPAAGSGGCPSAESGGGSGSGEVTASGTPDDSLPTRGRHGIPSGALPDIAFQV